MTLSGILNVNKVTSQEDQVLIIIINYPKKLDKALIQPGQVNFKVEF